MTDGSTKEAGMKRESVVVIGGTSGLGHAVAHHFATDDWPVVITGRDSARTKAKAREMGESVTGVVLDLERPKGIGPALAGVGPVRHLVIAAIERDQNTVREYDIDRALRLVTQKLVGYTEVVHALLDRLDPTSSIVLFGGMAKERPYPGSTTVTSVNGGVVGMVRAMTVELAPIRVNAIHPGIVGDSPYWSGKSLDHVVAKTPTGRLCTMADIVDAVEFLLTNPSVNGVDLRVDGGWITQ
jgi:NAD(P)-dependent dehydrogenase (short-subunit alcohol dehydrogenase family)